jgi:hypothetical protein
VVALLVLFTLAIDGVHKYQSFLEDSKKFQESEREKVSTYQRYDQYGGYGIRLLSIPPSIGIIYNGSFKTILANVNTGERLMIATPLKGKGFFKKDNSYVDIVGIILIFFSLFGLVTGYKTTKNKDYISIFSQRRSPGKGFFILIFSRAVIINLLSLLLISISFLVPLVKSLNLFEGYFLYFALTVVGLITFFFSIGAVVGACKKWGTSIILGLLFFLLVFMVPWMIEKKNSDSASDIQSLYDFEKETLSVLMKVEKELKLKFGTLPVGEEPAKELMNAIELALNNEFKKLVQYENKRKNEIYNKIIQNQKIAALIPVSFFKTTVEEITGSGGNNLISFYNYCQKRKLEFLSFYIKKRYIEKASVIESFVKKNENIYHAKSSLPTCFWFGIGLTLFYTVGLLFLSYRIHKKNQKIQEPKKAYQIEKEKDNPLFVLCENKENKEDIFNYYQGQKESVCLEKINTSDFQFNGFKAKELLKHLSGLSGVDEQKALENLTHMGIKDLSALPVCHEIILKIYVAVKTAADFEWIVMDNFLKNESRELQKYFFNLLLFLEKSGKKIIYLSCDMKQSANSFDDNIKVDDFKAFPMDLNNTSVR